MEHNLPADSVAAELIVVKQLPVIEERLVSQKEKWEQEVRDAESMLCTEKTVAAVKAARARCNQDFDILEEQRKDVKRMILAPYNHFESVYKDCVTDSHERAVRAYNKKISDAESEMKHRCEEGLRDYFADLCALHHLDWLVYERAGIKVDMSSAKAKTPKRLQEQLREFVVGVSESIERINLLDNAAEIMVEYQRSLNVADAICTVQERHRRIEEQKTAREAHKAEREREAEMVRRVEALAPPVAMVEPPEKDPEEIIPVCTFTAYNAPRRVLRQVRKIFDMEGIQYE